MISDVTYGGRVTDDWDRRLINVYATEYFNDKVLFEEKHKLADPNQPYYIPEELSTKDKKNMEKYNNSEVVYYYQKIAEIFPKFEPPETFGQHINAEISSQIISSNALINSIISLSPKTSTKGEESRESKVQFLIKEIAEKLAEEIDLEEVIQKINPHEDQNPLKVVLLQEIQRYNKLIKFVKGNIQNLEKGLMGLVLISEDLEKVMDSLFENKVPQAWKFCYHSLKPLYAWIDDLFKRVD